MNILFFQEIKNTSSGHFASLQNFSVKQALQGLAFPYFISRKCEAQYLRSIPR